MREEEERSKEREEVNKKGRGVEREREQNKQERRGGGGLQTRSCQNMSKCHFTVQVWWMNEQVSMSVCQYKSAGIW